MFVLKSSNKIAEGSNRPRGEYYCTVRVLRRASLAPNQNTTYTPHRIHRALQLFSNKDLHWMYGYEMAMPLAPSHSQVSVLSVTPTLTCSMFLAAGLFMFHGVNVFPSHLFRTLNFRLKRIKNPTKPVGRRVIGRSSFQTPRTCVGNRWISSC